MIVRRDGSTIAAAAVSGLVVVAIGYGCGGAPPPEPPDASEVQYSLAVEPEHPTHAAPGSDHPERESGASAPAEIVRDRTYEAASPETTPAGGPSPTYSAPVSAPVVRGYLARRFLYETWYPRVHDIDVRDRFASIVAWDLSGSGAPGQARRICDAALGLRRLRGASVRFGSRSVNCFSASSSER